MSDITELERRINSALDRIGTGLEALAREAPAPAADPAEMEALQAALAQERAITAELEERVRAIKEKQETHVRELEEKIAGMSEQMKAQEARMVQMKEVTIQLRESLEALREAEAGRIPDAHLLNEAMQAELEAFRALREAERGEIEALLGELKPLVGEEA